MAFTEAPHIKTPICARMLIPKDRLAVFTNYQSVIKDQALKETVLALFHTEAFSTYWCHCREVFTTCQARVSPEHYVIKCVGGR